MATGSVLTSSGGLAGSSAAIRPNRRSDTKPRWSKRRTLTFIIGACGSFWGALGVGAYLLLR